MNKHSDQLKKFTDIYSDFYSMVYNGIYTKIRNINTSSDLAQEVFTRFYERIDEVENPRQWLFGALRNVVYEHFKKNSVDMINIDEVFDNTKFHYVNGFRDTRIIIQQAIEDAENYSDEQERIIFELIAIQDYTYGEVARQMGLTERQVRYSYNCTSERIVDYLRNKGIKNLEELL
jgi:RNA polymerase sigma factor (sigma-70 family)